ncbi:MAG: hypothetical protein R3B84_17180 [Zavarzinella sp.]
MRFSVESGFVLREAEPRYFVRVLDESDDGWKCGYRWQIQLLNEDGQGAATIEFGPSDDETFYSMLAGSLPREVISAAMEGFSEYIDSCGQRRQPLFLGGRLA